MENQQQSFWQFSDQLRVQSTNFANLSINDPIWGNSVTTKRPEERRNFDTRVGGGKITKQKGSDYNGFNDGWKNFNGGQSKNVNVNGIFNKEISKASHKKNINNNNNNDNDYGKNNNNNGKNNSSVDKRFKTLPPAEALPRNETVGGYIFVCNNDTMQENLKRQLFGLPPRYRDSVRAITPGLPLFLYNYSTHQLHGIFEAASFGGTNIDPSAWEDKKCPGESRFPAQVRVVTRKICEPLEEDSFRPILHHYDGPKFRLELNIPEALALLDIFAESNY
ncbi:DCD (Development and Cell Death) domain protein [Tasmannia lanceolata]|uniref:DCD (Development and Cell Death) domain protein n=1 Tax=Tasmannia lanceolata TaxID=3420 RepID=UPI00406358C0